MEKKKDCQGLPGESRRGEKTLLCALGRKGLFRWGGYRSPRNSKISKETKKKEVIKYATIRAPVQGKGERNHWKKNWGDQQKLGGKRPSGTACKNESQHAEGIERRTIKKERKEAQQKEF